MDRTTCGRCGGSVIEGSMCPYSISCPLCGAEPKGSCQRPSGHRASRLHAARWRAAEEIDRQKGITYEDRTIPAGAPR